MAWEWSHTDEGISNALDNLAQQQTDWLAECLAEWQASRINDAGQHYLRLNRWDKNLAYAKRLPDDTLINGIWERASELKTCDNGGFDAWMCPYGCHTVSFSCD